MRKGEARRPRRRADGERRERALAGGHPVAGGRRIAPEQAAAERRHVGVGDHRVGGDALTADEFDPRDAAALGQDARHIRAGAQADAAAFGQIRDRAREPAQAALDGPDARLLHIGDQHQRGRRLERRGAAIGGVAPEELVQARIAEVLAERGPQGREGLDTPQTADPREPDTLGEIDGARPVGADERPFQRAVDLGRAGAEPPIALRLARAGEGADRRRRGLDIREQVEPLVRVPGMAGQQGGRPQPHLRFEVGAGLGEQLLEHPAHGEDGGARLDRHPTHGERAHLAADSRCPLQDGDVVAGSGEAQRRCEPANPGSDHDDAFFCHRKCAPPRITVDPRRQQCQV
ncbi:hypothetical protein MSPGM_26810 [Methylorubrum sp. GM97]|nr:hypothetical protein MSPGM_26810 [Methylorubrum sp. GM97]